MFMNGGWWHDANILGATGEGADKEEKRGWAGWWNEHIVTLVEQSMQQKDALNVLLTGRGESNFGDLIKRKRSVLIFTRHFCTSSRDSLHKVCLSLTR